MSRQVFADTSFFVAVSLSQDSNHAVAQELLRAHAGDQIVTTNHVRGETWTLLNRRGGHHHAVAFLDRVKRTDRIAVARVSAGLEASALDWLRRHDEREYSFVDATSFAFMRQQGLTEALAFDGDFNAAGFVELRP